MTVILLSVFDDILSQKGMQPIWGFDGWVEGNILFGLGDGLVENQVNYLVD